MITPLHRWQCDAPGCKAEVMVAAFKPPEGWASARNPTAIPHDAAPIIACPAHAAPLRAFIAADEAWKAAHTAALGPIHEEAERQVEAWERAHPRPSFVEPFPALQE